MSVDIGQLFTGIGVGIAGFGLWNTLKNQKVRLAVTAAYGVTVPDFAQCRTVTVVNESPFPVTISELGFFLKEKRRAVPMGPLMNGKRLPLRLEPRESVCEYFLNSDIDPSLLTGAFAKTECGKCFQISI